MQIGSLLQPDDILPFHGYRTLRVDGTGFERGGPEIYASIEHFYQSEKFRGVDELLRLAIIELPTAKEARKAAMHHERDARLDWEKIQNRVMATAIWLKCREHKEANEALTNTEHLEQIYRLPDHYWGSTRKGVSVGFYAKVLQGVRARLLKGGMRVLITGSASFTNRFLFTQKLDSFFNRRLPNEIHIGCNKGADWLAECWAIEKHLPVFHYPLKNGRSSTERTRRNKAIIDTCTHLVAFPQGQGGDVESIIELAAERSIPSRIVRLDDAGSLIRHSRVGGPRP